MFLFLFSSHLPKSTVTNQLQDKLLTKSIFYTSSNKMLSFVVKKSHESKTSAIFEISTLKSLNMEIFKQK